MSLFAVDQKRIGQALMQLPQPEDKVQCLYLWIDGTLRNFRDKSKTWHKVPDTPQDLPIMEFCGSATALDVGDVADYCSRPVKFYKDPFRAPRNIIVLCETYCREGLPTFANNRYRLLKAQENQQQTLLKSFVFEQSYSLLKKDSRSLCYMDPAFDMDSKAGFSCGRGLAESHYKACLYAGVQMSSLEYQQESQWKYSIGPCHAIELGDDVWTSRFLLERVGEDFGIRTSVQIDASLRLLTSGLTQRLRQAIVEALQSKFLVKDVKPIKIDIRYEDVVISGFHGDIDPYAFITKVIDTLQHLNS